MCGIVGYLGKNEALPILMDGLRRLEYRGYDSAGVSILHGKIVDYKAVGKINQLEKKIPEKGITGFLGVAHTRWATHGEPSEINAHPHSDCSGKIRVAHNGIIENYLSLKKNLEKRGHSFNSNTDTEVVPHLLESLYNENLIDAMIAAVKLIKGTYGLVAIHEDEPETLVVARCGSPLVIGFGQNETIIASDVSAILKYTRQVIYLDDGEVVEIKPAGFRIFNAQAKTVEKRINKVEWDIGRAEKGGYPHFMLKEIFEQPQTIKDSVRGRIIAEEGRIRLGGLLGVKKQLEQIKRIIIVACGTAWHSGLVGKYMLEEYAGIPVEVEWASEFRYRKPVLNKKTAVLAISQSGETADTLAAIREAKEKGCLTLGIVNVVGSTIARDTDAGIYNHIGPEIAVASTKAYTSQLAVLALMTVLLGQQRSVSFVMGKRILEELSRLPKKIDKIFKENEKIEKIAKKYQSTGNFLFMGRKYNQPTALEGALKLKELSYVHAEGCPSGEMKHGSIAMIDENFPSLFIAPEDSVFEKNISNMEEIKARRGPIIAITTENNKSLELITDDIIYIPKTLEMLTPILAAIPLQLFAYHMAALNGRDVDKPRNLAKSVTVE